MDALERLIAIEDIKQLNARYWQGLDTKDPAVLRSVFTDDAVIDFRAEHFTAENWPETTPPPDEFVPKALARLAIFDTAHQGHTLQVEFRSDSEADGVWPMEDYLWTKNPEEAGFACIHGHGYYFDSYRKTAEGWRISAMRLQRIHIEKDGVPTTGVYR